MAFLRTVLSPHYRTDEGCDWGLLGDVNARGEGMRACLALMGCWSVAGTRELAGKACEGPGMRRSAGARARSARMRLVWDKLWAGGVLLVVL